MKIEDKDILNVADEINEDIEKGIYDQWPKLKERLNFISQKIVISKYVINDCYELSKGELQTLQENDYMNSI